METRAWRVNFTITNHNIKYFQWYRWSRDEYLLAYNVYYMNEKKTKKLSAYKAIYNIILYRDERGKLLNCSRGRTLLFSNVGRRKVLHVRYVNVGSENERVIQIHLLPTEKKYILKTGFAEYRKIYVPIIIILSNALLDF